MLSEQQLKCLSLWLSKVQNNCMIKIVLSIAYGCWTLSALKWWRLIWHADNDNYLYNQNDMFRCKDLLYLYYNIFIVNLFNNCCKLQVQCLKFQMVVQLT